jgi:hypothetical protein
MANVDVDDLPDAGEGMCCMGAAALGPHACTCWEPEYDQLQAEKVEQGPMAVRPKACHDCAFRPGSPEQLGDPRYRHSEEGGLEDVASDRTPFVCHQGMRRLLRQVHPAGVTVESPPSAYEPRIRDPLVWKADGSLVEICAGWAARRP